MYNQCNYSAFAKQHINKFVSILGSANQEVCFVVINKQ